MPSSRLSPKNAVYAAAAGVLAVAALSFQLAKNRAWYRKMKARTVNGTVVETACGPVEYLQTGSGPGPYLLFFHGTPGGYDQGELVFSQHKKISFSRPGFLGTPLSTGETMEAQADAAAALLDVLGLRGAEGRVVACGASGGGPAAIFFAARHAHRCKGLLLLCAVTGHYAPPVPDFAVSMLSSRSMGRMQLWMLDKHPTAFMAMMLEEQSNLSPEVQKVEAKKLASDPDTMQFVKDLVLTTFPFPLRRIGFVNDLAQFAQLGEMPYNDIACPTLIIHGAMDKDVPYQQALNAHEGIDGAVLHTAQNGWHMLWCGDHAAELHRVQEQFLFELGATPV